MIAIGVLGIAIVLAMFLFQQAERWDYISRNRRLTESVGGPNRFWVGGWLHDSLNKGHGLSRNTAITIKVPAECAKQLIPSEIYKFA